MVAGFCCFFVSCLCGIDNSRGIRTERRPDKYLRACLYDRRRGDFHYSSTAGWVGICVAAVMIPAALVVAYKIFPKTRFGKSVTLTPPERQQGDAVPDTPELKELLGAVGVVLTPLRPVGMCDFSGKRVECVAESGYVDKDKKVKVIDVESTQLTVRIIEEGSREAGIQS